MSSFIRRLQIRAMQKRGVVGPPWPRFLPKSAPAPKRQPHKAKRRPQARLSVPANPVRSTRRDRAEQHHAKMVRKGHRKQAV